MAVLLAGGAGYIGSHTAVELLNAGHEVVIADDYSNSCPEAINRIEELTGKKVPVYEADIKDAEAVRKVFAENDIDCVIHFAGLKAVEYAAGSKGVSIFNLGTGTPYSVLEIVHAFEKANDMKLNYEMGPRRAGDLPESYANADKAAEVLGWKATRSLEDMCRDTWNWQKNNPNGYRK